MPYSRSVSISPCSNTAHSILQLPTLSLQYLLTLLIDLTSILPPSTPFVKPSFTHTTHNILPCLHLSNHFTKSPCSCHPRAWLVPGGRGEGVQQSVLSPTSGVPHLPPLGCGDAVLWPHPAPLVARPCQHASVVQHAEDWSREGPRVSLTLIKLGRFKESIKISLGITLSGSL